MTIMKFEEGEKIMSEDKNIKNFHYASDDAVVIITAVSESEAGRLLEETVKYPLEFRLDNIMSVD